VIAATVSVAAQSMIYLDTSVALAHLLAEDRVPPEMIWAEPLVGSRLVEYELWNRLNARGLGKSHAESARQLLDRVAFLEMSATMLARALNPFPLAVRTLDALHLASIEFLRTQHQEVELATYDIRMIDAAKKLRIPLAKL
jgi:predicted nucleic acid-binding protein